MGETIIKTTDEEGKVDLPIQVEKWWMLKVKGKGVLLLKKAKRKGVNFVITPWVSQKVVVLISKKFVEIWPEKEVRKCR